MKGNLLNKKELLFGELLELMDEQTELYESLKNALDEEKDRIISVDFKGINETSERKKALLIKIHRVEENRMRLMEDFSAILEIPSQGLTVANLMSYAPGSHKDRLKKSREGLLNLAERIRQMNHFNELLLSHSLELIMGSYSLLSHLAAPNTVYHSSGGLRLTQQNGKFISNNI
jgi:flagellar biosynthesis/type III secretory pathway chaperone